MSDQVIATLNAAYRPVLTAFEQFHRQEHRFQIKYRYKKLQKRYDKMVVEARCWRRRILNRVERLGGQIDSTMGPVVVKDEVKDAYQATEDILREIFDALDRAVAAAQAADDHVTHKVLMHLETEVDHEIVKVQAWLRQVKDLRDNYLVTVV
jgi:bacterioferritin (cytochrome b1)